MSLWRIYDLLNADNSPTSAPFQSNYSGHFNNGYLGEYFRNADPWIWYFVSTVYLKNLFTAFKVFLAEGNEKLDDEFKHLIVQQLFVQD